MNGVGSEIDGRLVEGHQSSEGQEDKCQWGSKAGAGVSVGWCAGGAGSRGAGGCSGS